MHLQFLFFSREGCSSGHMLCGYVPLTICSTNGSLTVDKYVLAFAFSFSTDQDLVAVDVKFHGVFKQCIRSVSSKIVNFAACNGLFHQRTIGVQDEMNHI